MKNPEIDPHKYSQLISGKEQEQFREERIVLSTNGVGIHVLKKKN